MGATIWQATIPAASAAAALPYPFRNRIINGAMRFDQRNGGAAKTINTAAWTYTLDRWGCYGKAADGVYTVQRLTATPPEGFSYYLRAAVTAADISLGASDAYVIRQAIEGLNVADLKFGSASADSVTISFWVRSSLAGVFSGSIRNGAANRSYPFTFTINAANTWEQKSITVAGDITGVWATDVSSGIELLIDLGSGTDRRGSAGAWAANNYHGVTGAVALIGTLNATFDITGIQIEKGTEATVFEYLPVGTELVLCQRYCETGYQSMDYQANASNNAWYGTIRYATTKRTAGAATISMTGWQYYSSGVPTGFTPTVNNDRADSFTWLGTPLTTANGMVGSGTWISSCEL